MNCQLIKWVDELLTYKINWWVITHVKQNNVGENTINENYHLKTRWRPLIESEIFRLTYCFRIFLFFGRSLYLTLSVWRFKNDDWWYFIYDEKMIWWVKTSWWVENEFDWVAEWNISWWVQLMNKKKELTLLLILVYFWNEFNSRVDSVTQF